MRLKLLLKETQFMLKKKLLGRIFVQYINRYSLKKIHDRTAVKAVKEIYLSTPASARPDK